MDEVNVAVIAPILGRDLSFVSDVDAASLGVLLVACEFFAFTNARFANAQAKIVGTGMAAPSGFLIRYATMTPVWQLAERGSSFFWRLCQPFTSAVTANPPSARPTCESAAESAKHESRQYR